MKQYINHQVGVCDFISPIKEWNIDALQGVVANYLIRKIKSLPIPISILRIN